MKNQQLENFLRQTLTDLQLSNGEREQLRDIGQALDIEQARFIRNRAFDLVREQLNNAPETIRPTLKWLEQVVKTLDVTTTPDKINASASFSPGDSCKNKILDMLHRARHRADICVFTIADDQITEAIIKTHRRGVSLRIVSDNDKSTDDGSDIDYLMRSGIPIIMDNSPYHMHHKFAIFDNVYLLNGSFNWTRSASQHNFENLLITDNPALINAYAIEFDKLWQRFKR
jgi:cardiolipin hydrolase